MKKSTKKSTRSAKAGAKSRATSSRGKKRPIMRHSRETVRKGASKKKPGGGGKTRGTSAAKRAYLDAFRREFPTTLKVMRAVPPEQAAFRPHQRSKSAVELAHTFSIENGAAILVTQGELPMPPKFPPPPATLEEAIEAYERGALELMDAVESMPETRLAETVSFIAGPGEWTRIPVEDVLWYMLMDSIHHRGQLSVYVRLAGGKVPSIYGPSADEPWR